MNKLEDLKNQTIIFSEEKQKYEILGTPQISLFYINNPCEREESGLIKLLIALGLVKHVNKCPDCYKELTKLYFNRNTPFKRCNTKSCNRPKLFLFEDTVFEQAKLPAKTVLWLLYYFSCRRTAGDVSQTLLVSRDMVKTFYDIFIALLFRFCDMTSVQLEGPVVNVHLDETPTTKITRDEEEKHQVTRFGLLDRWTYSIENASFVSCLLVADVTLFFFIEN